MSTMDQWTAAVCADLGLDASAADLRAVLDLTRDVAHGVARPAAPLTAYLVGVAVGRSTTAVPYDANEAGVPPNGPAPAGMPNSGAMTSQAAPSTGTMSSSPAPGGQPARKKARPKGTVLGAASDIPVGGGAIYKA